MFGLGVSNTLDEPFCQLPFLFTLKWAPYVAPFKYFFVQIIFKLRGSDTTASSCLYVTTMSNSGSYPVTPVASQLCSSTPVAHHLLQSRSHRYNSVKYDPWSNPCTVLTTPRCLPCLDVSSPCTQYISYLVSFSLDLT